MYAELSHSWKFETCYPRGARGVMRRVVAERQDAGANAFSASSGSFGGNMDFEAAGKEKKTSGKKVYFIDSARQNLIDKFAAASQVTDEKIKVPPLQKPTEL